MRPDLSLALQNLQTNLSAPQVQQPQINTGSNSDYNMQMSNWLHDQVNSGAWKNMNGKDIVDAFTKQRQTVLNQLQQSQQQIPPLMQALAQKQAGKQMVMPSAINTFPIQM